MRRILIENARRRRRLKRGGERQRVDLAQAEPVVPSRTDDLLAVDEALDRLAEEDPQKAELVKLRFFAGLSVEEAAACLDISRATADRWWAYARAWLFERLQ
jgi:RNA polymerase sigma factor (TIGR02999 family)